MRGGGAQGEDGLEEVDGRARADGIGVAGTVWAEAVAVRIKHVVAISP